VATSAGAAPVGALVGQDGATRENGQRVSKSEVPIASDEGAWTAGCLLSIVIIVRSAMGYPTIRPQP